MSQSRRSGACRIQPAVDDPCGLIPAPRDSKLNHAADLRPVFHRPRLSMPYSPPPLTGPLGAGAGSGALAGGAPDSILALSRSRNSLPVLKNGTTFWSTATVSP